MAGSLLSYLDIVRDNRDQLDAQIQHGELKPVFLWHLTLFTILPVSALVIPRRQSTRYVRPFVLVLIFILALEAIRHRRALLGANGYMVGLVVAWWFIWSATLLVFHDVEKEFLRVERKARTTVDVTSKRSTQNGYARMDSGLKGARPKEQQYTESLIWQPYPRSLSKRLNWSLGLLLNMRGPEWNWRISSMGPLPPFVESQLKSGPPSQYPRGTSKVTASYPGAGTRIRTVAFDCLKYYLLLDVIKVLMMQDSYFLGVTSPPPPPPFLLNQILPHGAEYIYRFLMTALGLYTSVTFVTLFNPLIFLGLSLLFPNAARSITATPLDAPWLYSDMFGPFLVPVLDHGLAGAWGIWWHQIFRFGFTSTAHWILSLLPKQLSTNSRFRRLLMTFVAFALSGFIHACGSYTQLSDTNPLSGTFLFFVLQFVGVTIQEFLSYVVVPALLYKYTGKPRKTRLPRWLRRSANAGFVFGWLWLTAGLIMDDFAAGGLWLTEPLPVSPLRGLGFVEGEGWWCWNTSWFQYWDGGSYWERGIRVM
ncbi:membrane bound O-acyl transferase family-domain-containing protein [Aspergillus pseudonomiae]|uniref:Membrane bound O-acyl transferase family-domain-containing protein n=1 Tax=Aspergillus pseudonomiae TaxID=1506151 RepID=A0A5N7DHJ7_9EURO|nr:membrane bound O-acyl transferase family-domain-containing protein [Aspergillus pseudonomiae]KAE8405877.1 membrane bound O-acyl transferase family-domain-containing protein [Aspergillus pseudonomiae]